MKKSSLWDLIEVSCNTFTLKLSFSLSAMMKIALILVWITKHYQKLPNLFTVCDFCEKKSHRLLSRSTVSLDKRSKQRKYDKYARHYPKPSYLLIRVVFRSIARMRWYYLFSFFALTQTIIKNTNKKRGWYCSPHLCRVSENPRNRNWKQQQTKPIKIELSRHGWISFDMRHITE